jgi:hypothetical protein
MCPRLYPIPSRASGVRCRGSHCRVSPPPMLPSSTTVSACCLSLAAARSTCRRIARRSPRRRTARPLPGTWRAQARSPAVQSFGARATGRAVWRKPTTACRSRTPAAARPVRGAVSRKARISSVSSRNCHHANVAATPRLIGSRACAAPPGGDEAFQVVSRAPVQGRACELWHGPPLESESWPSSVSTCRPCAIRKTAPEGAVLLEGW